LTADDILEELGLVIAKQQLPLTEPEVLEDTENAVFKLLSAEAISLDDICRRSGLSASVVASSLTMLELRGAARQLDGTGYVQARAKKVGHNTI
jgi:predicted Rossmann fold nucleotide-binding protein DprA/Smf involved in DNA uptake